MKPPFKRIFSAFLSALLLAPMGALSMGGAAAVSKPTVDGLKVCALAEPLGIDRTPAFSWTVRGTGKGEKQTAYQIVLSTSRALAEQGKGDVWDSGKKASEETLDLPYEGKALAGRTAYYWRVTVWDGAGGSAVSPVARFSTGVLDAKEWEGKWIGIPKKTVELDLTGTKWIWKAGSAGFAGVPAGDQYFRKGFSLAADKQVQSLYIGFTADDKATLYFNGKEISSTSTWSTGGACDLTDDAKRENVVAIKATNTAAGYAGMAAKIQVTYTDGSKDTILSDGTWKVGTAEAAGWTGLSFDDSGWQAPDRQVSFGESPWGEGVSLEGGNSRAAVMLRKEFQAKGDIKEAFAYICGLGFFDLQLNGQSPDDSLLNPYTTQYDETVLYRTFDVTGLLQKGNNAIGVELGNSYYNEIGGVWNWPAAKWRDNPKLLFRLEIRYADGSAQTVLSDESWKLTQEGPITANSMYYGDVYDARLEMPGWSQPGFDESGWKAAQIVDKPLGELRAQMKKPVKRVASFAPETIVKLGEGSWRVQCPEMASGWIRLMHINQQSGDKIHITYGQKLNADGSVKLYGGGDGEIGNWWPHAYLQQDVYTSAGRENETYEPKFSYKGFAYIQIDGYDGQLTAGDVIIYRVSNDVDIISEFDSSNPLFNRLHKMMVTAMADNFQGEHCDPLLEKMGWTGDANVSLGSLMYNFDMPGCLPGFIEVMEDGFEHYGTVPVAVPTADWWIDNTPVWNTLFVYGVRDLAAYFGAGSYTEEQYGVMRRYALKDIDEIKKNGWVWQDGQLADWVAPVGGSDPNAQYNENVSEGSGIAGTAYVYGMLEAMASFADGLRRHNDAQEYRAAMENIYKAFNEKFYLKDKGYYQTTTWTQIGSRTQYRQTSQLVPLAFGLVPGEYVDSVVNSLVKDIVEKDYHLDTGCVGTRYILPVLCDYGHADVAYRIATQDTYPSWGFWVENNAKGTWEMWESTTRSLDHYFLGTYDEWFYSHLAGIKEIEDGYKSFTVQPYMIGDLDRVSARIQTPRGGAGSAWELREDGGADLTVTVPFGATAKVLLPTARKESVTLDGQALSAGFPGVERVALEDGQVAVTIGSGAYTFVTGTDLNELYILSLEAAVADAEKYEAENIPVLNDALTEARKVLADKQASQKQVNAARDSLMAVLEWIVGSQARQALRAAVEASQTLRQEGFYQPEAWLAYRSALETARLLAADTSAGDAQLAAAHEQLEKMDKALDNAVYENLALGKTAKASSTHEDDYWGWGVKYVTDGNRKNEGRQAGEYVGYSSAGTPDKNHSEWIQVDLGEAADINQAVFYPASSLQNGQWLGYGFPVDFTVEVSPDGKDWTVVAEETDYSLPVYGPISFGFETRKARYVRLNAESLREKGSDGNSYRLQLSEIEVYRPPAKNEPQKALLTLGVKGGALDPVFHVDTGDYTAKIPGDTASLTFTPLTADGSAVTIEGKSVQSGQESAAIAVRDGQKLTLGVGGKTYTLTVTKVASTAENGKKALEIVLREAEAVQESGDYAGASERARRTFDLAYLKARQVYNRVDASEDEVTAAWTELLDAIHGLIPDEGVLPGDLNKDGKVTIQDVMEACKVLAR
ncbi:MAG: family 78 glycoside hydrolase catalytic domain, partial [Clostridiales bacterium]|nr:family 78 glycoside hydrolase catalytic domain [Clostridiales bacterium]